MSSAETGIGRLFLPLYNYADADRLAGVSRSTSRRWLAGYRYQAPSGERVVQPPVTPGIERRGVVSFVDLVEIVAIGRLRERGFSLRAIRQVVQNCQEILKVPRPLVTLRFKTGGREIFVESGSALLEVGKRRGEQAWREILGPFLQDLDYTEDMASRWWPLGRRNPIMIDPDYAYGFPVIQHSGVRTEIILERFQAGDLHEQIARDFNIRPIEVERALQFELSRAA